MTERPEDRPDWPEKLNEHEETFAMGCRASACVPCAIIREARRALELRAEVKRLERRAADWQRAAQAQAAELERLRGGPGHGCTIEHCSATAAFCAHHADADLSEQEQERLKSTRAACVEPGCSRVPRRHRYCSIHA